MNEFDSFQSKFEELVRAGGGWLDVWALLSEEKLPLDVLDRIVRSRYWLDRSSVEREDIRQRLLLVLGQELQRYRDDWRTLDWQSWLPMVVTRRLVDIVRELGAAKRTPDPNYGAHVRQMNERDRLRSRVRRLVATTEVLNDIQRIVARMWVEGWKSNEIGESLKLPVHQVESIKKQIRKLLKADLGDDSELTFLDE